MGDATSSASDDQPTLVLEPTGDEAVVLDASEREKLRSFARLHGEVCACRILGISRQTFARAVAGLSLRRATAFMLRAWLREARK
jgi:hypothetical protein